VARYRDQGEEGLKSRYGSHTGPRLAEPVRDKILELKKEEPTRGIKKVSQLLKRVFFLQAMSVEVELVTHQLNHRRLRSLDQRTPCQVYHDPARRLRLHGASRQRIFREVFEQFWQYVKCMPERNRHTTNAAWRLVVETWLRRQGWITVTQKPKPKVSTDSKPFFSQN
jgi:hypothetical protein